MKHLNIREKRIKKGWTQTEVGKVVGVTKQAIHDIETGKQRPSFDVLLKLLVLFGVEHKELSQLFAPVGNPHENSNTETEERETRHPNHGGADVAANLAEGERAVRVLGKAAGILQNPDKVAALMKDYGENGQVNHKDFRPIFEELREVSREAFV